MKDHQSIMGIFTKSAIKETHDGDPFEFYKPITCSCGITHKRAIGITCLLGNFYFNCKCGSTNLLRAKHD